VAIPVGKVVYEGSRKGVVIAHRPKEMVDVKFKGSRHIERRPVAELSMTRSNPRGRMRKAMYPDLKAEYTIMVDRDKTYRRKRYRDAMNLAKKQARTANEVVVTQGGNVVKVWDNPRKKLHQGTYLWVIDSRTGKKETVRGPFYRRGRGSKYDKVYALLQRHYPNAEIHPVHSEEPRDHLRYAMGYNNPSYGPVESLKLTLVELAARWTKQGDLDVEVYDFRNPFPRGNKKGVRVQLVVTPATVGSSDTRWGSAKKSCPEIYPGGDYRKKPIRGGTAGFLTIMMEWDHLGTIDVEKTIYIRDAMGRRLAPLQRSPEEALQTIHSWCETGRKREAVKRTPEYDLVRKKRAERKAKKGLRKKAGRRRREFVQTGQATFDFANPKKMYDPTEEQNRAVMQGMYESAVKKALGLKASANFKPRGVRLDVKALQQRKLSLTQLKRIQTGAFRMRTGVGQRLGHIQHGAQRPTKEGRKKALERYQDPEHLAQNRQDYETTLGLFRKGGFYRWVPELRGGKTVYVVQPGDQVVRSEAAAVKRVKSLNAGGTPWKLLGAGKMAAPKVQRPKPVTGPARKPRKPREPRREAEPRSRTARAVASAGAYKMKKVQHRGRDAWQVKGPNYDNYFFSQKKAQGMMDAFAWADGVKSNPASRGDVAALQGAVAYAMLQQVFGSHPSGGPNWGKFEDMTKTERRKVIRAYDKATKNLPTEGPGHPRRGQGHRWCRSPHQRFQYERALLRPDPRFDPRSSRSDPCCTPR
jgi:hypothetical protein